MNKFIVSGVPRSGTTALASLLNWHPTVFCGIERFPLQSVNQSHFTRESVNNELIPSAHFARNRGILQGKLKLDAIGDKGPRYFYRLAGPENEFSETKLIFIIRDIAEVFQSWNSRASNPNDDSWHRGQTGIFSYLDYLQLLFTLNRIHDNHDSLVISYEDMFFAEPAKQHLIIDRIFDFIGAPHSAQTHKNFDAESAKRMSLKKKKAKLSDEESAFLKLVNLNPLFSHLEESSGVTSATELRTLSNTLLEDFKDRRQEILGAVDQLMLPKTGISQAMTVMRLCYKLSAGNNFFSSIKPSNSPVASSFELLANMFNATKSGHHQDASSVGKVLLDRFPDCTELLVEMSMISDCLKDKKNSIRYTKQAMALQPGNKALFSRLKHLINKY